MTNFRRHVLYILLALLVASAFLLVPHITLAADSADQLQNPTGCWYNFDFTRCVVNPVSLRSSSAMLSMGGYVLRFSGSLFDFGVNQLIINFKSTLDTLKLVPIINSAWTFFRDLANILIIGIFVFVAISLILGLKEYGQKRLIARVLLIAVLMNFSLLFTKIVIDTSNFVAYAIYAQTAGSGTPGNFSIADSVLEPLKVTGVWDTKELALAVFKQPDGGGPDRAIIFGFLGMVMLLALAVVIFYGAFLILARAIIFIVLMFTAPIAYATYMAPHFESGVLGWNNWWRSLINNAAFAPLLMMFLSVSILIFGTASETIPKGQSVGKVLNDPRLLVSSWQVLVVYVLGTALLFVSFRMASSIAGAISGIKLGQMVPGAALAYGSSRLGWLGQQTIGRSAAKRAQEVDGELSKARRAYSASPSTANLDKILKLEKEKARAQAMAGRTFNPMNTRLGKAAAGSAGLSGAAAGETKGSYKDKVHAKEEEALKAAKAAALTDEDKKKMRADAAAAADGEISAKIEAKTKEREAAAKSLEEAAKSLDGVQQELGTIEKQMQSNRDSSGEYRGAVAEHDQLTSQRSKMAAEFERQVETIKKESAGKSDGEKSAAIERIERERAEHASAIDEQDNRIRAAAQNIQTVDSRINSSLIPTRQAVQARVQAAAMKHDSAKNSVASIEREITSIKSQAAKKGKQEGNLQVAAAETKFKEEGFHSIAEKFAPRTIIGTKDQVAVHEIHHGLAGADAFKKKTGTEKLLAALEKGQKASAPADSTADTSRA